jgi:hypothetical protein
MSEGYTLEQKRDWALAGKAEADAKNDRAREMGGGIPGFGGSGSQRAATQVRNAFGSADRAWREARDKLEYYTEKARGYERRIAERDRVRFTRADLIGMTHVKVSRSWYKVARLNAKTVSVETGYSWVDRYEFDKILDAKNIAEMEGAK